MGWIEIPAVLEAHAVSRKRTSSPGPYLLHAEVVRERIGDPTRYPFNLPAVRGLATLDFHPQVTFFVGENGSGKSTLLEAIAVGLHLNPEGGSRNFHFGTRQSHSTLGDCLRLAKALRTPRDSYFLRAESFYNVATEIERLDRHVEGGGSIAAAYGERPLHEQSHGESFFALFENRFGPHGLYLLDEPEAALSPTRQVHFLGHLHDLIEQGGQFVIATHSPIILAYPRSTIYHFSPAGIASIAYTETEHYLVTRGFLANPARTLSALMGNDAPASDDSGSRGD